MKNIIICILSVITGALCLNRVEVVKEVKMDTITTISCPSLSMVSPDTNKYSRVDTFKITIKWKDTSIVMQKDTVVLKGKTLSIIKAGPVVKDSVKAGPVVKNSVKK